MAIKIKGIHDIKTHGSLARGGKLVSVARDWHKRSEGGSGAGNAEGSDSWNVQQHVFRKDSGKGKLAKKVSSPITSFQELNFGEKIKSRKIEELQNSLVELEQADSEGLPVSANELERIKARLAELQVK